MTRVAVAASSQIAADAGAEIANAGGNAVDAALAASLVSMCTDTGIMSPAGGAFIAIWPPDADPIVIDGYAEMPGRSAGLDRLGDASWEVVFDYGGETHSRVGFGAVATPGAFAGIAAASEAFGACCFADLLGPVIRWAQQGFPLRGGAAEYLAYTHEAIYSWQPESYGILHHDDGSPLAEGDRVFVPDLADSLRAMAREGVATLYGGSLGQAITAGVQGAGGLLGIEDLRAYRAELRAPIRTRFGPWEIATAPAPSVGGPVLAAMLELLRRCPAEDDPDARVAWLARTQHAVLEHRRRRLDGAGPGLPDAVATLLALSRTGAPDALRAAPETIHTSALDSTGLACSLTASAGYGAGALVPGTGLWLNNSLGEMDLHTRGLSNLAPGMRLASNMAPTVARHDNGTTLAIGSPGASRITTAIAQTLWQHLEFGRHLEAAVAFPRLHVELLPDRRAIAFEPGLNVQPFADLALRPFPAPSMYFGGIQAARRRPDGSLQAVGDARRAGCVAFGGT